MTNAAIDYLLARPAQGYRAGTVDADAVLIAPTGERIATFLDLDDALHTADALNSAADDASALALAAGAIKSALLFLAGANGPTHGELQPLLRQALLAIDATPARAVGAISTGPGGGK